METINIDPTPFALFNYHNHPDVTDTYVLGDIVYKEETDEVGVIIQVHGNDEYRTDQFGNCWSGELKPATKEQIKSLRKDIKL